MPSITIYFCVSLTVLIGTKTSSNEPAIYQPDWESLDKRPLPKWYDDAKVGIFLHWGVFSVPSYESEWFWWLWKGDTARRPNVPEYMKAQYAPKFAYADFASEFRAEFFNPEQWVSLFVDSGAKYVVLTAKHHEGFCNWPSETSWQWNSVSLGPQRDLVGCLAFAIRNGSNLHFGLYHSLFEWFNPLYIRDKESNFSTREYVNAKVVPEMKDLVMRYKPEIFWSDGDVGPDVYWGSTEFIAWLYNESPVKDTVVTNDRWGDGCMCKHGDFYTCQDHYRPGRLVEHKWENCLTLDRSSWGYRRESVLADVLSIQELVYELASTIAFGGNILINVGPTSWGTIAPIYEERLRQLGTWLRVNGESIYATQPWTIQNDQGYIWYTSKTESVMNASSAFWEPETDSAIYPFRVRPLFPKKLLRTVIYAIITQWTTEKVFSNKPRCFGNILLPSITALPVQSEFYLLTGEKEYKKLDFRVPSPRQPGVRVIVPESVLQLAHVHWGCVIKIVKPK